jgi:hypothetical protein
MWLNLGMSRSRTSNLVLHLEPSKRYLFPSGSVTGTAPFVFESLIIHALAVRKSEWLVCWRQNPLQLDWNLSLRAWRNAALKVMHDLVWWTSVARKGSSMAEVGEHIVNLMIRLREERFLAQIASELFDGWKELGLPWQDQSVFVLTMLPRG